MRLFWCVIGVAVLAACDDDGGGNAPDTVLDEAPAALSNQSRIRIGFHADGDANTFYCQLDGGDVIECVPPFEADVADGPHEFRVAAALNKAFDTTPAEHAWTTDATPPETTISLAPPALDNSLTPTFEFSGTDPGGGAVTFECTLDGDPYAACTSPASLVVVDGAHTFSVRARDAAGNVDGAPAEHAWTIDATAPDTMITAGPGNGETTGRATSFSFMSPDTAATFECKLDDAAFAPCTSPRAFPMLASGEHTFTVRAKDTSAIDPSPARRTWTVDATPPDVTITSAPSNPSNDTAPDFAFSSLDATATFECQIDGAVTFEACTSPWTGPTVPEGARTFRIRASDPYGNVSAVVTHAWVVDLTPPETTLTAVEPSPTADATADFAFASPTAGATFECALDGGPFGACTSPLSTAALADGEHSFAVRAVDTAGNADPTPASHTWRVDASPPDTTITVAEADPTNDPTGDFAFVASEPATFQCAIDGGAFAACPSPFATPALAQGLHALEVRAVDSVGNVDPSPATYAWTIDTTPPETTIVDAPPSPTSDPTGDFTFTSDDAAATFQCSLDSAAFAPCTPPFSTVALADGAHTFRVRAIDAAGNVDPTADSHTWTIDTIAPSTTLTAVEPSPTADATGDFAFSANQAGATFECSVDGAAFAPCTSPFSTAPLATGSHTFAVRAVDPAGNTDATPATHAWDVDVTPPQTTITSAPADPTAVPTATFTFTSDEAGTFECSLDSGAFVACTSPRTTQALADGPHTFVVRARDTVGNVDATPASHSWTVDTTPPETAITAAPPALTNSTQATFALAANPDADATFECSLDNATFTTCSSPTTLTVGEGPHTFRVRARDALGNTDPSPASHAWTVDLTPPTVTITSGGGPTGDDPERFAFVKSADAVQAECRVDTNAFAPCTSPFDGPVFGVPGSHVLEVRVTDGAGNVALASRGYELDPVTQCLDGAENKGDAVVSGQVENLDAATVEFWFRGNGASGDMHFVDFDVPSLYPNVPAVGCRIQSGSFRVVVDARHNVTQNGALNQVAFALPSGFSVDAWHHYAVVFTGDTQRVFLDGVELTSFTTLDGSIATSFVDALGGYTLPVAMHVGYFARDNIRYAAGGMRDLRVSRTSRYTQAFLPPWPTPAEADTVLLYPMAEGQGTTSSDAMAAGGDLEWTFPAWNTCTAASNL